MLLIIRTTTLLLSLLLISASSHANDACNAKVVGPDDRIVCVCNEEICRDLDSSWPKVRGDAHLISSSKRGKRFHISKLIREDAGLSLKYENYATIDHVQVVVDIRDEQQTILGWGGAFTDASGINVFSLSKNMSDKLIESYYGKNGLQYNFGRVPIGGCDFSPRNYTYDDTENFELDYELKHWSLAEEDLKYKIPLIKRAQKLTKASHPTLNLIGSPWSPPAWMKTSRKLVRGFLIDDDRVFRSYAKYLIKFFEAYEREGVGKFWGMTVQNEPIEEYSYVLNSLQYDNEHMRKFIVQYLGPELNRTGRGKGSQFRLMIGDDNTPAIKTLIGPLLKLKEVRQYISGVALHWYRNADFGYEELSKAYQIIRGYTDFVLNTEASSGFKSTSTNHIDFGSWQRGEDYATDIIEVLDRLRSSGWIDWNLALDMNGGPNYLNCPVDSSILVSKEKNEFYKQPMYYALAHFSRFFKPRESIVLGTKVDNSGGLLRAISAHNKREGYIAVNILNTDQHKKIIHLKLDGSQYDFETKCNQYKPFVIDGNSINSVIVKLS